VEMPRFTSMPDVGSTSAKLELNLAQIYVDYLDLESLLRLQAFNKKGKN